MSLEETAKLIGFVAAIIGSISLIYAKAVHPIVLGLGELLDIARWVRFQLDTDSQENLAGVIRAITQQVHTIDSKVDTLDAAWSKFAAQAIVNQRNIHEQVNEIKAIATQRGPRKVRTRQTDTGE